MFYWRTRKIIIKDIKTENYKAMKEQKDKAPVQRVMR